MASIAAKNNDGAIDSSY